MHGYIFPLMDSPVTSGSGAQDDFASAWEALFRVARRAKGRAGTGSGTDLGLAQYALLEPLTALPVLTVSRLAEAAEVSQPTASRMLETLERTGHVIRRTAENDRRQVLVELTDHGAREVSEKGARVAAIRDRLHESLSEHERREAVALLRRLEEIIEDL